MCVHVDVVAADVPLRAPVWDGPEAERRIMLVGFLELWGDTDGGGLGGGGGRGGVIISRGKQKRGRVAII